MLDAADNEKRQAKILEITRSVEGGFGWNRDKKKPNNHNKSN